MKEKIPFCPNPRCNKKYTKPYWVDDYSRFECSYCGTKWISYDPENKIENCENIVIGEKNNA